jgi:hypothetical protein
MELTAPKIDFEKLAEAAEKAAMTGALKEIEEYYTGWNSPYREAIKEELKKKGFNGHIQLPEVTSLINKAMSNEVDRIVNTAVAKTYVPQLSKMLVGVEKEVDFSEMLKEFIEATDQEDMDECECNVSKSPHGWLNVTIKGKEHEYELTLHEHYQSKKENLERYCLLGLPNKYREESTRPKTMTIHTENARIEIPFTQNILSDDFMKFCAGMLIADSVITMDTRDFDQDMFPEQCHC